MPKQMGLDHQNTQVYIPNLSQYYPSPLREAFENVENRYIHEGRRVFADYTDLNYVDSLCSLINLDCIYKIDEHIVPRFVLEFYSCLNLTTDQEGEIFVNFTIQNLTFSFPLPLFGQILGVPTEGHCLFTHEWSLDALAGSSPFYGKYATILPSSIDIRNIVQNYRRGPRHRSIHGVLTPISVNQILTSEIVDHLKPMAEIIRENVFCLAGNRDHVPACLSHILYCVAHSEHYNLAYYMAMKMEFARSKPNMVLPYGMLLTRLFRHVMYHNPQLTEVEYYEVEPVMLPLTHNIERKTRKDYGARRSVGVGPELRSRSRRSAGSSSFAHRSSSIPIDDDDELNDEGTSRFSTPSPVTYVNSLPSGYPQIIPDLPPKEQNPENFSARLTKIMNMQHQARNESRGAWKSIGKSFHKLLGKKK